MTKQSLSIFPNLKHDLPSSVVVFLVALPLCLGIALASGAPLLSGLIAGIVGGLVVGSFSRSQLSVSGPAAGLVVIVLAAIEQLGSYEAFLVAVVLAGVLQLALAYLRAGIIGLYFPSSVIKGMLAAIGLILILKQLPHLVGFDVDAFGEMEFWQKDGHNTFSGLWAAFEHVTWGSLIIGMACLLLIMGWGLPAVQRVGFFRQFPSGVAVVLLGVLLNLLFGQIAPQYQVGAEHLVSLPVFASLSDFSANMVLPDFDILANPQVYVTALTLAIVASLETLLSVEAIDKIDPHKRHTPQNVELRAQGLGNIVSGILGGLPITAVIVRSSANLDAGARTKMSAIYHGIWLLLAVAFFPRIMNLIPLSALAAILVMVGYKLTKPALYKAQWRLGRERFIPFVATIVAILFTDLLIGILIGMAVGVFYILKDNYKVPYFYHEDDSFEDDHLKIHIRLSEHVSFLNKARLQLMLAQLPSGSHVTIDGSLSKAIDYDVLEILHDFRVVAEEKGIKLNLTKVPELKGPVLAAH